MDSKSLTKWSLIVLGAVLAVGAGACSGDDDEGGGGGSSGGGGGGGFRCPEVGDKTCPNDNGATQADVTACAACETELRALAACTGPTKCGADGKSETPSATKCKTENDAVIACYKGGGSAKDAGGD